MKLGFRQVGERERSENLKSCQVSASESAALTELTQPSFFAFLQQVSALCISRGLPMPQSQLTCLTVYLFFPMQDGNEMESRNRGRKRAHITMRGRTHTHRGTLCCAQFGPTFARSNASKTQHAAEQEDACLLKGNEPIPMKMLPPRITEGTGRPQGQEETEPNVSKRTHLSCLVYLFFMGTTHTHIF